LAAAITLAHAGRQVVVHETHKEVGYRFGGDFQGLENWTTEEDVLKVLESLGLTTDFIAMPGRNGTVFDPAPQGYAYLLVMNGKGTVKSCMFSGFKQEKTYVKRTVAAFEQLVGLSMKNPQPHGGSGNFRIPKSAYSGPHPQVGEQAGFQDTLWGFGMRLAIHSGVLAAQSLLNGENYDTLWQRALRPQMQTSVVNRALFSILGNRGYGWFLRHQVAKPNLRQSLRRQYQVTPLKRLLGPWATRRYESRRKDITCDHIDCHCIWCRGECCVHD